MSMLTKQTKTLRLILKKSRSVCFGGVWNPGNENCIELEPLLPLYRGRWFTTDVIRHAVDAANFIDDATRHLLQQRIG
jgi:hypothetical protein